MDDYILFIPGIKYYIVNDNLPLHRVDIIQLCKQLFLTPPLHMVDKPSDSDIVICLPTPSLPPLLSHLCYILFFSQKNDSNMRNRLSSEFNLNHMILELTENPVTHTNPLQQILESKSDETESFRKGITRYFYLFL